MKIKITLLLLIYSLLSFGQLTKIKELVDFRVYDSEVYNNELYLVGETPLHDTIGSIVKWDETNWSTLPPFNFDTTYNSDSSSFYFFSSNSLETRKILTYNGKLLIAKTNHVIAWDGTEWKSIMNADSYSANQDHGIFDMIEYKGDLIISGQFMIDSTTYNLVKYDGNTITSFGDATLNDPLSDLCDLEVVGNDLYLTFIDKLKNRIHKWDGSTWTNFLDTNINSIGIHVLNNKLIYNGGIWDGVNLSPLDFSMDCLDSDATYTDGAYTICKMRNANISNFLGIINNLTLQEQYIDTVFDCPFAIENFRNNIYLTTSKKGDIHNTLYKLDNILNLDEAKESILKINVFPLPFSNTVNVSFSPFFELNNTTIQLFDMLGKKYDLDYRYTDDNQIEVNTKELDSGFYVIQLVDVLTNEILGVSKLLKK